MTTNESGLGTSLGSILGRETGDIDALLAQAIHESRQPAGVAGLLQRLANGEVEGTRMTSGVAAILGGAAANIARMLPADDPYAALGRLTVEMYDAEPPHWAELWPERMIAAVHDIKREGA